MIQSVIASKRRGARLVVALAIFALLPTADAGPEAAQQRPQFRTTVEVVQMQVAVADSEGTPISGLSGEDFRLRIDGEDRDIVAAYEVDLRAERAHEQPDYVPPAGWRQFLLFFDFSFTSPRGVLRAQRSARSFLREHTHPRDLIGVAKFNRISGVQLLVPFTTDRQQVLDAVGTLGLGRATRVVDPAGFVIQPMYDAYTAGERNNTEGASEMRESLVLAAVRENLIDSAKADFRRYREAVVGYAEQLGGLGELLQATRGRKHVILFSQGFDDKVLTGQTLEELAEDSAAVQQGRSWEVNSETRFGSAELRSTLSESLDELRAADAVIHAMDTSGLGSTDSEDTFLARGSGRDALNFLAEGTNGSVAWNVNDLTPSLERLARRTAQYYVVAYRRQPEDPETVDVDLEVRVAGAEVVSAPEILAPPPDYREMSPAQRQMQLAEFVTKGIEEEEAMVLEARATPFRGRDGVNRVAVLLEVPWQQLTQLAERGDDAAAELQVLGYLVDRDDRMVDLFSREVNLDVEQMESSMAGAPFRYYDLLLASPGDYRVRLLVRDKELGLITTRNVPLHMPSFADDEASLSGPFFVDMVRPGLIVRGIDPQAPPEHRAGAPLEYPFVLGDEELTPQLFTVMSRGERCRFMLQADNLGKHPFTGEVQSSIQAVAVDERGRSHPLGSLQLVDRNVDSARGSAAYLLEATVPDDLGAGAYLLEVTVTDGITGRQMERTMPFTVTDETASF